MPATKGMAQAKQRREKESHGRQRDAWIAGIFSNAQPGVGQRGKARFLLAADVDSECAAVYI